MADAIKDEASLRVQGQSCLVITPNHPVSPPAAAKPQICLHNAPLEGVIEIEAPFDPQLNRLIRQVPGQWWDWKSRHRFIPATSLKRFVLGLSNDPVLKERYWPLEAQADLCADITSIVEEFETGRKIRKTQIAEVPDWVNHNGVILRPYQMQAALWLAIQHRGLLAFDCGLGKTIISLTALKLLRSKTPTAKAVVVCPAGIKNVWSSEIKKFTDFTFKIVEGTKEERIQAYASDAVDILILNYDLLTIDAPYIHQRLIGNNCLIADEASYVRNECERTKAFQEIVDIAPYCWFLSATPLMNSLLELYNLIGLLDASFLDPWPIFERKYVMPEGEERTKALDELREVLSPIMFIKRKDEVTEELPEKIFKQIPITLTEEQRAIYNQIRQQLLQNLSPDNPQLPKVTNPLAELTRLKEVCDSLQLLGLPESRNPKIEEVKRLLNEDLRDEKVILFTQFERMAKILERELKEFHPVMLSGSLPVKLRGSLVNQFQADPSNKVFITTTAGGMGITLTAASAVIFYDTVWNPKLMDQVIGRADRIGNRNKTILVLHLIAENSIEEKILELTKTKSSLFDSVMENGDIPQAALAKLTPEEIKRLAGIPQNQA